MQARLSFSIHASAKEATPKGSEFSPMTNEFSIHASAKEATINTKQILNVLNFSIHASAKEATESLKAGKKVVIFSIHASAKEATKDNLHLLHSLFFQSTPPRRRRPQHIVIPQLSCAYLVSTTFLSTIFSFISQYIVLFPLFRVRMPCVFCVAYDSHYVPLFNIFYILFQGTPF